MNYSISNINSSSTSGYVNFEIACCESPVSTTTCGRVSSTIFSSQMTGKQSLVIPLADQYNFQFRLSNINSVLFSVIDIKVVVKGSTVAPTGEHWTEFFKHQPLTFCIRMLQEFRLNYLDPPMFIKLVWTSMDMKFQLLNPDQIILLNDKSTGGVKSHQIWT